MLDPRDRARIALHLERGWVVPDSLVRLLWAAWVALEPVEVDAEQILSFAPAAGGETEEAAETITDMGAAQHTEKPR